MKRILFLFLFFLAAVCSTPPMAAAAAPDPLACTGYTEPRVFLDAQSWWMHTPGKSGTEFGHVHVATCFPLGQTVAGTVPFDIRLTMHNSPGAIRELALRVKTSAGIVILANKVFSPRLTCAATCDFWVHLDAVTTKLPNDGYQRVSFKTLLVEPDGNEQHTATGWRMNMANGKPRQDDTQADQVTGTGWYSKATYANSSVFGYTYGASKSGTWPVKVSCNATGMTVTGCLVTVDPNFHLGIEGTVLLRVANKFSGTVNVDTRRFTNGPHKLVVRTDINDPRGSTLSGVLGLPFAAAN